MLRSASEDSVPEANRVSLDRIAQGLEFRTTVMIKDVPNKLTRAVSVVGSWLGGGGVGQRGMEEGEGRN